MLKTYTAQTGFVYQYYFVGQRTALADDPEAPSAEYIFDVSSDRKTTFAVSIFLPASALAAWAANNMPRRSFVCCRASTKLPTCCATDAACAWTANRL
jgi:hypothetical protein